MSASAYTRNRKLANYFQKSVSRGTHKLGNMVYGQEPDRQPQAKHQAERECAQLPDKRHPWSSASSSGSQLATLTVRDEESLTWASPSIGVHWCPPPVAVIVTHLVTRAFACPAGERLLRRHIHKGCRASPGMAESATVGAVK